jgi:hypothetical protein
VFAGFERSDGLCRVIGDRRVDVNRVHVGVIEQVIVAAVANGNVELVADFIQFGLSALANCIHINAIEALVDRDEFGSETEAYDGDIDV